LGRALRRWLPEPHLTGDTKDTVKVAVGLIATMSALLLGLLVGAAKDSYDTVRKEVVQMSAQVAFLDRVLGLYGAEAASARASFHASVEVMIQQTWSKGGHTSLDGHQGDSFFLELQRLEPRDDTQRLLKGMASNQAVELGRLRTLLYAQSQQTFSRPLLVVVVLWLVVIFFGFSVIAPPNPTAFVALVTAALSVAGAIFLILALGQPFTGLLRLSDEPMTRVLHQIKAPPRN
jgi:hypothetical protein